MGNKFTRISKRTIKNKKNKSKYQSGHIFIGREGQYSMFPPVHEKTVACMKCMSGFRHEIETNRLNGKRPLYSGRWEIRDRQPQPICGAQFDAKKFDKMIKLKTIQLKTTKVDESENDDSQYESTKSESDEKHSKLTENDDSHSYDSIFAVFEKLEHNAHLNDAILDEMFFYPAMGKLSECDDSKIESNQNGLITSNVTHFHSKEINFSLISEDTNEVEATHIDATSLDEKHIYATIPSTVQCSDNKEHNYEVRDSKNNQINKTHCETAELKPIPFNATQFDTRQIDVTKFTGILFNDSQFDAKYFDSTQCNITGFNFTQFCLTKLENAEIYPPQIDSKFNASQFDARKFEALQSDTTNIDDDPFHATKFNASRQSPPLDDSRPDVTEYNAALIRTAQYVAAHFGGGKFDDSHCGDPKEFRATEIETAEFNASQFNAKQFDLLQFSASQFNAKQFNLSQFSTSQFKASNFDTIQQLHSQFDAKSFEAQLRSVCSIQNFGSKPKRFVKPQIFPKNRFNVTQFDASIFRSTQFKTREIYAT